MTNGEAPRFSGKMVHDPSWAAEQAARRHYIHGELNNFVDELPVGEIGTAPNAALYTQPDATTCFYGSLGGIATASHGRNIDIRAAAAQARQEGLLGAYGAETFPEHYEPQVDFVRRLFSIDIRFIASQYTDERIHAVTRGLVEGEPVVFGLHRHWVALDGIKKSTIRGSDATWTGMNPYPRGRRIEDQARDHLPPSLIADRLVKADLPVIVVSGASNPDVRLRRHVRTPRFRPAPGVQSRTGSRMKRAE